MVKSQKIKENLHVMEKRNLRFVHVEGQKKTLPQKPTTTVPKFGDPHPSLPSCGLHK